MTLRAPMSVALLLLSGCSYDVGSGTAASTEVVTDRCELSGLGMLANGDLVAGTMGDDGSGIAGAWLHTTSTGEVYSLTPSTIECRINGRSLATIQGEATVSGSTDPFQFTLFVEDRGVPGDDVVTEGTPEVRTLEATRRYRPTRWEDARIDERVLVTIPSELPVTVGNAGNRWAWLRFQRSDTLDVVTCRYRGGASTPVPDSPAELAAGASYTLERCTGELPGSDPVDAGSQVDVRWLSLHVHTGAHRLPSRHAAETTVTVDLDVTPLTVSSGPRDFYAIDIQNLVTADVTSVLEDVVVGDLTVTQYP